MPLAHDYSAYRDLLIATFGVSLASVVYVLVGTPSRVASRLGTRGLKRLRAIEAGGVWAQAEPFVRWLGVRVSGLLSDHASAALDRRLALAGDYLGWTPEEYVASSLLGALAGIGLGLVLGALGGDAVLCALLSGLLGGALPYLRVSGSAQERLKQISRGLPSAIDLMALGMSAGLDFPAAVKHVVDNASDEGDALIEELRRLLQELKLGRTRKQALAELGERAPTSAVTEFVAAMIQAEERGNPVVDVLSIQTAASRHRRTIAAEKAAARAGVAMVVPLLLLFLSILILLVGPAALELSKGL